jgi:hypothetical protein
MEKSAVVKHCINLGYHIHFYETSILAKKPRCMEPIIRLVTETEFHPDNKNGEGFSLGKSCKTLVQTLKEQKETQ